MGVVRESRWVKMVELEVEVKGVGMLELEGRGGREWVGEMLGGWLGKRNGLMVVGGGER